MEVMKPRKKGKPKMRVQLIDYTGINSSDKLYAAKLLIYTKETRLTQGEDTRDKIFMMTEGDVYSALDYIARTIRSSWEFVDYTFEISGVTRAFTHQLVRTRTASYAQQAQRVVNMSDFEALLPDTVAKDISSRDIWTEAINQINYAYKILIDKKIPAQDARGLLPTNVLTNIIMKANLRTMADLLGKRRSLRAQGEYADVARAMESEILRVHPWADPFINPERTKTPALNKLLQDVLGDGSPIDTPELNAALKELDLLKGTWG